MVWFIPLFRLLQSLTSIASLWCLEVKKRDTGDIWCWQLILDTNMKRWWKLFPLRDMLTVSRNVLLTLSTYVGVLLYFISCPPYEWNKDHQKQKHVDSKNPSFSVPNNHCDVSNPPPTKKGHSNCKPLWKINTSDLFKKLNLAITKTEMYEPLWRKPGGPTRP